MSMKISSKGRYAVKIMLDMAKAEGGQYCKIREVAKRQDITEKYLEQIMAKLLRGGFVKSTRGANGGYMLVEEPKSYTIGMILRLVEGSLNTVDCIDANNCKCLKYDSCETLEVWEHLDAAISSVVDHITIADLMKNYDRQSNE